MKIKKRIESKLNDYIRSRYAQEIVVPLQGLFNQHCHSNCVEYSRLHKEYGIAECIYIDKGIPILHYINTKNGIYYETTLGWQSELFEYYIIRQLPELDYKAIHSEFYRSRKSWNAQFVKWYHKLFLSEQIL